MWNKRGWNLLLLPPLLLLLFQFNPPPLSTPPRNPGKWVRWCSEACSRTVFGVSPRSSPSLCHSYAPFYPMRTLYTPTLLSRFIIRKGGATAHALRISIHAMVANKLERKCIGTQGKIRGKWAYRVWWWNNKFIDEGRMGNGNGIDNLIRKYSHNCTLMNAFYWSQLCCVTFCDTSSLNILKKLVFLPHFFM